MTSAGTSEADNDAGKLVIYLVHGTGKSDTDWVKEGSPLRNRLSERLGAVEFRRSDWKGRNTHTHRMEGAKLLGERLGNAKANAGENRFIIAHSHGGNVVLYALQKNRELNETIDGIVCMATPFLCMRKRKLSLTLLIPMCFGLVGFVPVLIFPTASVAGRIMAWAVMFCIALCLVLMLISLYKGRDRRFGFRAFWNTMKVGREDLATNYRLPEVDFEKLLIIHATGDEASGGLTSSQFLSYALTRIWTALDRLYGIFHSRMGVAVLVGLALAVVVGVCGAVSDEWRSPVTALRESSPILAMVLGLGLLSVGLIGWMLASALVASQAIFGFDAVLLGLDLQTTAEASPPFDLETNPRVNLAPWQVIHIGLPRLEPGAPVVYDHCRLYSNERVVDKIADWILIRIKQTSQAGAVSGPPSSGC